MTVDTPALGGPLPVGEFVHGRTGGHPACAVCAHVHRVTESSVCDEVTYDTCCPECGCTANRASGYDDGPRIATVASIDDYRADDHYDLVAAFIAAEHDDDDYTGPRCLPGPSDAGGTRPVDPGRDLRRGRLGWLLWLGVPRLAWYLCRELVDVRRNVGPIGGRSDHRGDADPAGSAGPVELRSVVSA